MDINDIFGKKLTDNETENQFRRKIKKTIDKIPSFNYGKIFFSGTKSIPPTGGRPPSATGGLSGGKPTKLL